MAALSIKSKRYEQLIRRWFLNFHEGEIRRFSNHLLRQMDRSRIVWARRLTQTTGFECLGLTAGTINARPQASVSRVRHAAGQLEFDNVVKAGGSR